MTDPLDILFENLLEHLDENLPGTCWPLYQRESRLENALLASLTPEQIELLESYQAAACAHGAGGALPLPLRLPPGPGAVTPFPAGFFAFDATVFWPRSFWWMWSWPPLWRPSPSWPQASLRQSWRLPVSWRRSFSRRSWRCPPSSARLSAWRASSPLSPPPRRQAPRPRRCPRLLPGIAPLLLRQEVAHSGLMQKGFLNPRPAFLNMVWPQTGQSSFTGTSQVMKSHFAVSSLLFTCSQQ